jgi:hypothetical protein
MLARCLPQTLPTLFYDFLRDFQQDQTSRRDYLPAQEHAQLFGLSPPAARSLEQQARIQMGSEADVGQIARDKEALAALRSVTKVLEAPETKEAQFGQIQAACWQIVHLKGSVVIVAVRIGEPGYPQVAVAHLPLHKQLEGSLTHAYSSTPRCRSVYWVA